MALHILTLISLIFLESFIIISIQASEIYLYQELKEKIEYTQNLHYPNNQLYTGINKSKIINLSYAENSGNIHNLNIVHASEELDDLDDLEGFEDSFIIEDSNEKVHDVSDPLYKINSKIFILNEIIDVGILTPIVTLYKLITPDFIEDRISNFVNFIKEPSNILFSLAMFEGENALIGARRFTINGTLGALGIFDVDSMIWQNSNSVQYGGQDFMRKYLDNTGPYIVLPLMGPSNLRNTTGQVINILINPLDWMLNNSVNDKLRYINIFQKRVEIDSILKDLYKDSNPYFLMRTVYQRNDRAISKELTE